MSAELYSNGHGQYSLEQLPDFYPFDTDEIESNVQVHTFASQRDADFFFEGVEASGRLEMDMAATQPVLLPDGYRSCLSNFPFPGGIPSDVAPETPGSIHEGRELGYALSHATESA